MTDLSIPNLCALMGEWRLALTAERKSPKTIALYLDSVARYLAWAETHDVPPMRRTSLQTWTTSILEAGRAPGTARLRQRAVRRYAAWLTAVGHCDARPFEGMSSPKLDQPVVDPLTVDQIRALLRTCHPARAGATDRPRALRHVRDEAIIRLMAETAIRGEVITLTADDLDLGQGLITIQRGKGGRGRTIPVGPATTAAIRTYLATRHQQRHADRPELWLGERGCGLAADGLNQALRRRARYAGIYGFHLHRLRHTAAHRWLAAGGGSESGLMAMAGWSRTDMLVRDTRATAAERAAAKARRLDLGNL